MANPNGLSTQQVNELQKIYGKNVVIQEHKNSLVKKFLKAVMEPIFLLLTIAAMIYFILGEARDGIIMLGFVLGIVCLDVVQEWKTDKSLSILKQISKPSIQVLRDGVFVSVSSVNLVPGDLIHVEEGCRIPADGYVIASHDFCLDESLLTGESGGVWKNPTELEKDKTKSPELSIATMEYDREDYCYTGTLVTQGNATILIDKIGSQTVYGKIGNGILKATCKLTPLQLQMNSLTKACTAIAFLLFVLVSIFTFFNIDNNDFKERVIQSLLSGIVLSLSMIPAEFPVILTVFLSMGALRLAKKHGLIRKLTAVETLGAVSVICVDKTGTITKNKMNVSEVWEFHCTSEYIAKIAGMACDMLPYDPMERAILLHCNKVGLSKEQIFDGTFRKGYPFTQECKTMAHLYENNKGIIITAKGAPEWLIEHSKLNQTEQSQVKKQSF